jgi:hypothetical protein
LLSTQKNQPGNKWTKKFTCVTRLPRRTKQLLKVLQSKPCIISRKSSKRNATKKTKLVLNFSENVVVGSEHKQCAKPRTVNLTILSNGVIHKIGRRKTALRCFGRNRSNHCKQKEFATATGYKVMQPMSMTETQLTLT